MPFNDVLDKKIVFKTHLFIYSTEIFRFLEANEMYIYIHNYNYVDIYITHIYRQRQDRQYSVCRFRVCVLDVVNRYVFFYLEIT